jgi:hypothetical protein
LTLNTQQDAITQGVTPDSSPSQEAQNTDVNASPSSSETPATDKTDLLSVVMSVAPPNDDTEDDLPAVASDEAASEPEKVETDQSAASDKPAEKDEDPTPEEMKGFTPNAQKRIRQVIQQRNELRTEIDTLRPAAENYAQIQSWLTENKITGEDYQTLLGVGAALRKGDYQQFLEGIAPYVQVAQEALGLRLPAELREQVEAGVMPEEAARELVQTRHKAAMAQQQVQEFTQTQQAETQQRQAVEIKSAIDAWDADLKAKDPDYAAKAPVVQRFAQAIIAERGIPKSSQQALEWANEALEQVNNTFSQFRPAPKPTAPRPSSSGQPSSGAVAEPRNLMEAALQGLARARSS